MGIGKRLLKSAAGIALSLTTVLAVSPVSAWGLNLYGGTQSEMPIFTKTGAVYTTPPIASNGLLMRTNLPSKFDLREDGTANYVTPVKLQNPWNDCWSFGSSAAAEITLNYAHGFTQAGAGGKSYDLSELHTAWFMNKPITAQSTQGLSQVGEGHVVTGDSDSDVLDTGGSSDIVVSMYASGMGPVSEKTVPNKNASGETRKYNGVAYHYAADNTWGLDESLRFHKDEQVDGVNYQVQLSDSNFLTSPASVDSNGMYMYDPAGTLAIKQALYPHNGNPAHGVAISFCADESSPSDPDDTPGRFINDRGENPTYAHYAYSQDGSYVSSNHLVCIVGWDDEYSASNFLEGHQPPGDGAWIVKNSWGAADQEFPNKSKWGVDGSGYFYISYYDMSLNGPTTFDFADTDYQIAQYDLYTHEAYIAYYSAPGVTYKTASVFTAEQNQALRAVSVGTESSDQTANVDVYLLDDSSEVAEQVAAKEPDAHADGFFPNKGVHRMDLEGDPLKVKAGQRYAVVYSDTSDEYPGGVMAASFTLDNDYARSRNILNYGTTVVNPGESYVIAGMTGDELEWNDWTEFRELVVASTPNVSGIDNPPIKVMYEVTGGDTDPEPQPEPQVDPQGGDDQPAEGLEDLLASSETSMDVTQATGTGDNDQLLFASAAAVIGSLAVSAALAARLRRKM